MNDETDPRAIGAEELRRQAYRDLDQSLATNIVQLRTSIGADPLVLPPRPDRLELAASQLLQREVPPRDYLLADMLSTTSRWIVNGATGVGKTLFGLDLAFAIAGGTNFLSWKGGRVARVAYFDGEMPFETMKERIQASEKVFGLAPVTVYNRDILEEHGEDMPPFNTEEGQAWLWREIEEGHYACAIFDNVMTLTGGAMNEEEAWRPMIPLIRRISAVRCAQVWLHHTGHDTSRGYGTKTREWNMDTVLHLSKEDPEAEDMKLEFHKARLRKPETAHLFAAINVRRDEAGWTTEKAPPKATSKVTGKRKQAWFLEALDEIAGGVTASPGHTGQPVYKVKLLAIRDHMLNRGHLEADDNGKITGAERTALTRTKQDLVAAGIITIENKTTTWRIK